MTMPFILKNKNILMIILGIVAVFTLILSTSIKKSPSLTIVSSIPTSNAQSVGLTSPVEIIFSAEVDATSLTITSSPSEIWSLKNIDSRTILANHKFAYGPFNKYVVSIYQNNKPIGDINFTTIKAQGDLSTVQIIEDQMKIDYPLSKKLPYTTSTYKVVYSSPMTLEITLKNSNLTSAEVIEEVKSWVGKNGGDVASHKYVIATAPTN